MIYEIEDRVELLMSDYIDQNCKVGDSDKTGLDRRAFSKFFYNDECIIVPASYNRTLRYYGGFEYIDDEYISQYGDYIVYSAEADRVREVIDNLQEETEGV